MAVAKEGPIAKERIHLVKGRRMGSSILAYCRPEAMLGVLHALTYLSLIIILGAMWNYRLFTGKLRHH